MEISQLRCCCLELFPAEDQREDWWTGRCGQQEEKCLPVLKWMRVLKVEGVTQGKPSAATKKRMTKILIEEFLIECQGRPDSSTRRTEKKQNKNHHFGGIWV